MIAPMRFTELHLVAADLIPLEEFYLRQLGLRLVERTANRLCVQAGRTKLCFEAGAATQYHLAFNIPPDQFAAAKIWIANRTALIRTSAGNDEIPFPAWNAHALYFYDPAGNVLEFIARHNLPAGGDVPFGALSIRCVSEVGMVVPDVVGTANLLNQRLDLPVFDGEGSATFCAMGDEDGLFIIVPPGREWFPETDVISGVSPVTVVLDQPESFDYTLPDLPYRICTMSSYHLKDADLM